MTKAIKDPFLFRLKLKQMILKSYVSSSLLLSGEIKNKLNLIQLGFQGCLTTSITSLVDSLLIILNLAVVYL